MKRVLLLLLMLSTPAAAQERFELPPGAQLSAIDYLEKLPVADTARALSADEKHKLCRLFAKAYVSSIRQHGQDYPLNTNAPVYRLLAANFPAVKERAREGGAIIFLGAITGFFNARAEYRADVINVLRAAGSNKHCR